MTLSIMNLFHYAECHCAECHNLFIGMLSIVRLNVVLLSVVAPKRSYLSKFQLMSSLFISCSQLTMNSEAVFLVVCDPSIIQ
jgi:hypothetical protein